MLQLQNRNSGGRYANFSRARFSQVLQKLVSILHLKKGLVVSLDSNSKFSWRIKSRTSQLHLLLLTRIEKPDLSEKITRLRKNKRYIFYDLFRFLRHASVINQNVTLENPLSIINPSDDYKLDSIQNWSIFFTAAYKWNTIKSYSKMRVNPKLASFHLCVIPLW